MASSSRYLTREEQPVMLGLSMEYFDNSIRFYRHTNTNGAGGFYQDEVLELTHEETVALKEALVEWTDLHA